jgi:hypothetical protein
MSESKQGIHVISQRQGKKRKTNCVDLAAINGWKYFGALENTFTKTLIMRSHGEEMLSNRKQTSNHGTKTQKPGLNSWM